MDRVAAYMRAAAAERAKLPALQREHVAAVVAELEAAQQRIIGLIAASPTAATRTHWEKVGREIDRQLELWRRAVSAQAAAGIDEALSAGVGAIARPFAAAGVKIPDELFRLDPRTVGAIRSFTVERLRDVATTTRTQIRGVLTQQALGTLSLEDAVDQVNRVLGGTCRRRAMTITYTEIGRGHSLAQYESMLRATEAGLVMTRRWVKSGKREPRGSHVAAHDQVVAVTEPFEIFDIASGEVEHLRYPRDPRASARNTVNCGCSVLPVVDRSTFEQVDPATGELMRVAARMPGDARDALAFESLASRDARNRALLEDLDARLQAVLGRRPGG